MVLDTEGVLNNIPYETNRRCDTQPKLSARSRHLLSAVLSRFTQEHCVRNLLNGLLIGTQCRWDKKIFCRDKSQRRLQERKNKK